MVTRMGLHQLFITKTVCEFLLATSYLRNVLASQDFINV